jgi:hypothetical protein
MATTAASSAPNATCCSTRAKRFEQRPPLLRKQHEYALPRGVSPGYRHAIRTTHRLARRAPDPFRYTTHPTISDNGLIAFLGERVDGGPRGIWVKNAAGPATLIAENGAGGLTIGDASCAGGCDVNDNGQVVFWSPLPSGGAGVYVGSGGPVTPLFQAPIASVTPATGVQINDVGLGAFRLFAGADEAIVTGLPGGPVGGFVGTSGAFDFITGTFRWPTTEASPSSRDSTTEPRGYSLSTAQATSPPSQTESRSN